MALVPWLGPGWMHDHVSLLANYDRVHLPPGFAWSITPALMSNLRAALHSDLRMADDLAVRASTVVWVASLAALGALGGHLGGAPKLRAALRVTGGGALAMAVTGLIGRLLGVSGL